MKEDKDYQINIKYVIQGGKDFYQELQEGARRFKSWEYCYSIFNEIHKKYTDFNIKKEDLDYLCLHLAFYLASWGMYRGSSFLLQTDYKIHKEVILELLKKEYDILWGIEWSKYIEDEQTWNLLEELSKRIGEIYKNIRWDVQQKEFQNKVKKKISTNDISQTLITKVLMGTMGCVPAYDTKFVKGIKTYGVSTGNFNIESVRKLVKFYNVHFEEFEKVRETMKIGELKYPQMKLLDMCFWQLGVSNKEEQKFL